MKRFLLGFGVLAALAASPRTAHANGRFPESNHLFFAPTDDQVVVLRTTFGLLLSHDRGASWSWVCEQALPLSGVEDPMLAITPASKILATTFQGLSIATNGACDWNLAGGDLATNVFVDLAADPASPKRVVVFASSYDHQDDAGGLLFASKLWETSDDGQSFTRVGANLDATLLGYTVDLAKSDAQRVYVSAVRNPGDKSTAALLVSKDHGGTWTEHPVPLQDTERAAYIAAVDPANADKVYVRTSNAVDKPTRLLLTEDAGATWKTVYQGQAALLGFALSDDGSKVYVGGPKDGIRVASTTDFNFKQTSNIEAQCLAIASDGLWACSNEKSGFIVALSHDEGATFEKKTHFCDIKGPLACDGQATVTVQCAERWPSQQAVLGCGPTGDDENGDGGASSSSGGTLPDGGTIVQPGGGCDCRAAPASPLTAFAAGGAVVAFVLARRRRRP